jgi:hypothetical protein
MGCSIVRAHPLQSAQRVGHPQVQLLGEVSEIEEHSHFGFAQGGQEWLCRTELEEFYG